MVIIYIETFQLPLLCFQRVTGRGRCHLRIILCIILWKRSNVFICFRLASCYCLLPFCNLFKPYTVWRTSLSAKLSIQSPVRQGLIYFREQNVTTKIHWSIFFWARIHLNTVIYWLVNNLSKDSSVVLTQIWTNMNIRNTILMSRPFSCDL